jgi:hypothetical protein
MAKYLWVALPLVVVLLLFVLAFRGIHGTQAEVAQATQIDVLREAAKQTSGDLEQLRVELSKQDQRIVAQENNTAMIHAELVKEHQLLCDAKTVAKRSDICRHEIPPLELPGSSKSH